MSNGNVSSTHIHYWNWIFIRKNTRRKLCVSGSPVLDGGLTISEPGDLGISCGLCLFVDEISGIISFHLSSVTDTEANLDHFVGLVWYIIIGGKTTAHTTNGGHLNRQQWCGT